MTDIPLCILDNIVGYAADMGKYSEDLRPDGNPVPVSKAIRTLLSVSHDCRQVASPYAYQSASVTFAKGIYSYHQLVNAPQLHRVIEIGCHRYVRQLQITFDLLGLYDYTVYTPLKKLLAAGGKPLQGVKELILIPTLAMMSTNLDTMKVGMGLSKVVDLLKEHLPNLQNLVLDGRFQPNIYDGTCSATALACILRTSDNPVRLSLVGMHFGVAPVDFYPAQHIQHMCALLSSPSDAMGEFVKRYASTLQSLKVSCATEQDFTHLLANGPDNQPVVYRRLESLEVVPPSRGYSNVAGAALPTANPFPVLTRFKCYGYWQLTMATIMCWTLPNLKSLETHWTLENIAALKESYMLTPGACPNLETVGLMAHGFGGDAGGRLAYDVFLWNFKLAPGVRHICTRQPLPSLDHLLPQLPALYFLHTLDIPKIHLSISMAIQVISKFSSLSSISFTFKTSEDVSKRGDLTDEQILTFQQSVSPTIPQSSLQTLGIHSFVFSSAARAADHIFLAASLFKSIRRIKVRALSDRRDSRLKEAFAKTKERECFKSDYRLLYMPTVFTDRE
ncbi:hypothetical protein GGI12_003114 [Dipsacomyces acuminosporus]|nr:hypothetical protein GGI12_003114 [Dipsacomyces acuminosporus]